MQPSGKSNRRTTGREAEQLAQAYLQEQGIRIVCLNWRCPSGEIDIVAEKDGILRFVEVRSRSTEGRYGTAVQSVNYRKQRQVRETAQVYLYRTKQFERKVQFDVIAIQLDREGQLVELQHIENAF
jgi:putative endonuclease